MSIIHANNETFKAEIANGITLVDFHADWCGPCQALGPILDEVSSVVEGAKIVKVNVDEAQDVAAEFSVMSIPTMIIFKDGQKMDQKVGVSQKEDILNWIEKNK